MCPKLLATTSPFRSNLEQTIEFVLRDNILGDVCARFVVMLLISNN